MNEDEPTATVDPLLESAWGLIANAANWGSTRSEWRIAAERWRDEYHDRLRSQPTEPAIYTADEYQALLDALEETLARNVRSYRVVALECASRLGGRMGGTAVVTVIQDAEAFLRWLERP